jgi:hypothetical protein
MAMPSDSSRTYQATISMLPAYVQSPAAARVAICSTLRVGLVSRASVPVPVKFYLWRF